MKNHLLWLLLVLCWCCVTAQSGLTEIKNFGTNPGKLVMYVHMPAKGNVSPSKMPLVVVMHGCSQTAEVVARQSGWNKLADAGGFCVVYPQQRFANNPGGCFNWFKKDNIHRNTGESGSVKQMVDYMMRHYHIDSARVFVYGLSAGAAMSTVMMADYPEIFNTGAVLAGGPYITSVNILSGMASMVAPETRTAKELGTYVRSQNPGFKGRFPGLIVVHGEDDNVVNIKNSYELVKQWTDLHGTKQMPDSVIHSFANNSDVQKDIYLDRDGNAVIKFYRISNLGHALAVSPGSPVDKGGETGLFAVDKGFHSTYWIAVDFGLIEERKR